MLDALPKGYSVLELIWDASAGQAMVADLNWVHPKKITFHESLTPRVLTEENPVAGEAMLPFKWIYHRYKARSGYDTRAGIMRVCAWMYLFKNYDVKDWVGFAEVFGKPLRLGKYDAGASKEDKEALSLAVRSLGADAAGIISKATEIEFVEAKLSGSLNIYQSLADFCDAQMSKAILGQTLTSDSGSKGSGSYALGSVHNEVRGDLTRADAKALSRTISQQLIAPVVGFNFGWDAPMPRYEQRWEEPEDLEAVGRVYQVAADLIDISQEHVSERFKIPLRKNTETPLLGRTPKPAGQEKTTMAKHILKQLIRTFTSEQQALEDLAADTVAAAADHLAGFEAKLLAAINSATSYEVAAERLLALYPELNMDAFADLIGQTLLNSELYGRSTLNHGA
jgi:phage gp29-like protein